MRKRLSLARKNVYKRIKRANEKFASMTKAEKRVQIAKDVITQLQAKKIKATPGTYVRTTLKNVQVKKDDYGCSMLHFDKGTQAQDVFKGLTCDACALGSMFLCAVDTHDKLKMKNLNPECDIDYDKASAEIRLDNQDMYDYLSKFFNREQLYQIECAFEGSNFESSARLYKNERNSRKRLRLIMENIVNNEGTFVPEVVAGVEPEYREESF